MQEPKISLKAKSGALLLNNFFVIMPKTKVEVEKVDKTQNSIMPYVCLNFDASYIYKYWNSEYKLYGCKI